jgi:hypothetical protein
MKPILMLFLSFLFATATYSQIIKKLGKELESDARWKVRMKANQKMDQALDSIVAQPKKVLDRKKSANEQQQDNQQSNKSTDKPNQPSKQTANINVSSKKDDGGSMDVSDGYVTLFSTAEEVFKNGTVVINGQSLKYGSFNSVKLVIEGPEGKETKTLPLDDYNNYSTDFGPDVSGDYTITAYSSNGKVKQSTKIKVLEMELTNWDPGEEEVEKAEDKLKEEVEKVEQNLGAKDKDELEKKIEDAEEKIEDVKKLYKDLGTAMKELGASCKKGMQLSPSTMKNLSDLNDLMWEQQRKMKEINQYTKHEPYDNTVCEYLVMLNEACAAFSTFTNIWSKSLLTITKNIMLDKGVPKAVEVANNKAGIIPPDYDAQFKQPAKLFAAVKFDAESLTSKSGAAGFTGDIIQFASDFLMKKYCGIFKGELKHDYSITYRNKAGTTWWKYNYQTEAAVTLRYPKTSSGKIIKMKGNIEGNAIKFNFYQDVEKMDEFAEQMKSRAKLTPFELHHPIAVPFATSQKDELGFGAVARALATPAYFNIPIDAEYDTDEETVKLQLNDALVDFGLMVKYVYGYVAIAAGIPLITKVDFPVNKARLTLNAVVAKNNELKVTTDSKNNLTINGSGTRHIGEPASPIEHIINYTLTAKKDN